ncbi:MAG: 50S ribosomal protein L32 [Proteobacteria bacterium]|nr:50S ribosomal protein L32 [Pseudomonadota bacterium]
MALPKHKTSKSRRGMRHSQWKLEPISVGKCPQCGDPKMPHCMCPSCGAYKGRIVVAAEKK